VWIFTVNTQNKNYSLYTEEQGAAGASYSCDDVELFKALQNCREEDFKLYFNGLYQPEIGYILDVIIYTADQSPKVKTVNPQVTKDIKKARMLCHEQNKRREFKNK
jgi:hypothetical protein